MKKKKKKRKMKGLAKNFIITLKLQKPRVFSHHKNLLNMESYEICFKYQSVSSPVGKKEAKHVEIKRPTPLFKMSDLLRVVKQAC